MQKQAILNEQDKYERELWQEALLIIKEYQQYEQNNRNI
jgi:hypothetical protein